MGLARAKALTLLAEPLSAEAALDWGLIARMAEDTDFPSETRALAEKLAAGPAQAYRLTKQSLEAAFDNDLDRQLALEAKSQQEAPRLRRSTAGAYEERWWVTVSVVAQDVLISSFIDDVPHLPHA